MPKLAFLTVSCLASILLAGCQSQPVKKIANDTESAKVSNDTQATLEYSVDCLATPQSCSSSQSATTNRENNTVQTDRYTTVTALPSQAQSNLLSVMISVTIPKEIQTIDDTARYLLRRSGYRLAMLNLHNEGVKALLQKSLPEVHRKIGVMRLSDALTMLGTPTYEIKTDHVNRMVSYQLKPQYRVGVTL
jgi:type IV pili sensor histidine kinase/response regulator